MESNTTVVFNSITASKSEFVYPAETELGQVIIDFLGDDARHYIFKINTKTVGREIILGCTLTSLCSEDSDKLMVYHLYALAPSLGQGVEGYIELYKRGIKVFPALNWEDCDCISLSPFGVYTDPRGETTDEDVMFKDNTPNNVMITVRGEHRLAFNKVSFAKHVQNSRRCPLTNIEITDEHMIRIGEIVLRRAPFQELVIG